MHKFLNTRKLLQCIVKIQLNITYLPDLHIELNSLKCATCQFNYK